FHINLGRVHNESAEYDQALACYQEAMKVQPDSFDPYFHIGNLYRTINNETEAINHYRKALEYCPEHAPTLNNLGNSLRDIGLREQAIACYQLALKVDPTTAEAYTNMGNAYKDMNKPQEAMICYQKALEIRPAYPDPYNNIGYILQLQGKLSAALAFLNKALELAPDASPILHNIGNTYKDMGEFDLAIRHYRKALTLTPRFPAVHSNILFAMNYAPDVEPAAMFHEARQWWVQQAAHLAGQYSHGQETEDGRRLRIGFVSPDFCVHSVSFFFRPLLRELDKSRFETFCYAEVKIPDAMKEELRRYAGNWLSTLGMSDQALADKIFADRIDILVDLAGHSAGNRLLVFARKPAPIQATWLGYPNTTGLATMDYRITDEITDPTGQRDPYYSEALVRLPHGFLCYSPPDEAPAVAAPPCLSGAPVTFGSFNNLTKITKPVIKAWAAILSQAPESRLLLKGTLFSDPQMAERFIQDFAAYGITPDRIVLRQRTESLLEHLSLYHEVDIGLDPFPYNGTTTTCEALWMGVPVICLRGGLHSSRVSASILTQVSMSDLIAASEEDYILRAVGLARDKKRLAALRAGCREAMRSSLLCRPESFARDMENAFLTMWNWRRQGLPAREPQGKNKTEDTFITTPAGTTPNEQASGDLVAAINSFSFWYHKIDLGNGIVTPGWAPISPQAYRIPDDFTGKRVLDVGTWDGYWTFEALRRGAREVIAIDDFSDYLGALDKRDRKAWETFDLCKKALGYPDERCKRVELSIYDLNESTFGHFDIIFFFGTLYNLRYPLLALDILSTICDQEIYVETAILDDFSPYRNGLGNGYAGKQMVMEFYPHDEYGSNQSNWWAPTLYCLLNMMDTAGFTDCRGWKLMDAPTELSHCRGFAYGRIAGRAAKP
ncbi:MAG: tetratricopeptide repeat protein, partial [Syntrophobacterales bacterium]